MVDRPAMANARASCSSVLIEVDSVSAVQKSEAEHVVEAIAG